MQLAEASYAGRGVLGGSCAGVRWSNGGYGAWVGTLPTRATTDALTTWFGPPAAA